MDITLNLDFLASVVGTQPGELSAALKVDDEGKATASTEEIQNYLKSAFQDKLKNIQKDARDEGYGRAKRESLEQLEKELADEFGVERRPVKEMFTAILENAKTQAGTIDPNDIKNSEPYQQLKKTLEEKLNAVQSEYDKFKSSVEFREITSAIKQKGNSILASENYELPENEEMRANLLSLLVEKAVNGQDVKFSVTDGQIQVTDKDGRNVLDAEGNPVTFDRYFTQIASNYIPKREGQKRTTPGGQTVPPAGTSGLQFPSTVTKLKEAQAFILNNPDFKTEDKKAYLAAARERFPE